MVESCKKSCDMVTFCTNTYENQEPVISNEIFNRLYKLNYYNILRYFIEKTANKFIAEDLTQETFTKAYQNLDKITYYCNVRAWLYSIASNILIDYWRRAQNKLSNNALDISTLNLQTIEGLPYQDMIQGEVRQRFRDIFKSLPFNYCLAICLHEYENHTYEQAANIMKLSLTAYTSLLNRARNKLREAIIADLFGIDKNNLSKNEYSSISKCLSKWISHHQLDRKSVV